MGLTAKTRKRAGSLSQPGDKPLLTPLQRGALYLLILIGAGWVFSANRERATLENTTESLVSLRDKAYQLYGVMDEELYGPQQPVTKTKPRPVKSAIDSLTEWGPGVVPSTKIHGVVGGWSMMDNVYLLNGTILLVSDEPTSFPALRSFFSPGVSMENAPSTWPGREVTEKDMRIIGTTEAYGLFGNAASRIEGTTFMCNDAPQFVGHYYHFVAEILFGLWRTYSMLDLSITHDGNTTLAPLRRLMFPRVEQAEFNDYSNLSQYIMRAVFPSVGIEYSNRWLDLQELERPYVFDRLVIGDRISAERAPEWPQTYKYAAPPFALPGSTAWWAPVRANLVKFLMPGDRSLTLSPEEKRAKTKPVITYVSRQAWNRRMLDTDDDAALVQALLGLQKRYGWEVNLVYMDKLSQRDQLLLAVRTTVMLGVHGNGLTHSVFMDPDVQPVLMEFFMPDGYSSDYEYPMRQLGITYYGWWGDKHFDHAHLPEYSIPKDFQGNSIPIDGEAVAKLIVQHVQSIS